MATSEGHHFEESIVNFCGLFEKLGQNKILSEKAQLKVVKFIVGMWRGVGGNRKWDHWKDHKSILIFTVITVWSSFLTRGDDENIVIIRDGSDHDINEFAVQIDCKGFGDQIKINHPTSFPCNGMNLFLEISIAPWKINVIVVLQWNDQCSCPSDGGFSA